MIVKIVMWKYWNIWFANYHVLIMFVTCFLFDLLIRSRRIIIEILIVKIDNKNFHNNFNERKNDKCRSVKKKLFRLLQLNQLNAHLHYTFFVITQNQIEWFEIKSNIFAKHLTKILSSFYIKWMMIKQLIRNYCT